MKTITVFLLIFIAFPIVVSAQSNLATRTVVSNLDTPWEILWGPDNFIWVTERMGKISRINPVSGEIFEVIQIAEAKEIGEGGLLGMVIDPDFSMNNYFYVAYNYFNAASQYREKIVRFTFNPASGKAANPFVLIENIPGANNHNGCRLIISPDKKLIITTGDAQNTSYAQDLKNLSGKILRLNLDGTIPVDNPIAGNPVWSWGHRNPQGLAYSPDGKILYSSEHGPSSNDEINIIEKGRNFGWPNVEGFCDNQVEAAFCRDSNVVEPIYAWTPTLAVAGMEFYNSNLIPEWKNSLLVASLKASRITQLQLDTDLRKVVKTTDFYTNQFGRLRDLCISPDGKVYIAVSNKDGRGSPKANDDRIVEIAPGSTTAKEFKDSGIKIFPNPATKIITVTLKNEHFKQAGYTMYNANGAVLKSGVLNAGRTSVNLSENYSGLAFFVFSIDNNSITKKLLVNH